MSTLLNLKFQSGLVSVVMLPPLSLEEYAKVKLAISRAGDRLRRLGVVRVLQEAFPKHHVSLVSGMNDGTAAKPRPSSTGMGERREGRPHVAT